jgi:hypothetical protein
MKYFSVALLLTICIPAFLTAQTISFSELNFNSDSTTTSGDWVELMNSSSTTVDISGWYLKDESDLNLFMIPANTTLAPGARIVLVNDSAKFSQANPFISNYVGTLPFSFGNDGDQVRLFDPLGNIQQFMEYADSTPWYRAADGSGRTLEKTDPALDPNDPANWIVGCMFGSPGVAYVSCNDPLVFGEINYNSDSLLDSGDWCEIWNRSGGYINLNGWSFKDSKDDNIFHFPNNISLAPDERLVLAHDTVRFFARHPQVTNLVGPFDFNLSNDGELIRIFGFDGKLRFSLVFNDKNGWPEEADGDGYTLELLDPLQNMNSPADWFAGCLEGSPGYAYDPDCNVGVEPVHPSELQLYHSLTDQSVIVQIPGPVMPLVQKLIVIDRTGRIIRSESVAGEQILLDVSDLPAGMYVAGIITSSSFISGKFIVQ